MSLRGSMLSANAVTRMLVCIDETPNYEFAGTIFSPYLPQILEFSSVKELLDMMDRFFDDINFPQSYYTMRNFDEIKNKPSRPGKNRHEIVRYHDLDRFDAYSGRLATFNVYVKFRKNATWQGEIYWNEMDRSHDFRSTLELLRLLEEALTHTEQDKLSFGWEE